MALKLNTLYCLSSAGNTGFGNCFLNPKNVVGAIKLPPGTKLTPDDIADLEATIDAGILDIPQKRFYPIAQFEQVTDNTEAETIQTLGYGTKSIVREGDYDLSFQFTRGGLCLLKALRTHNDALADVLFIDSEGLIFGRKVGDDLMGVPALMYAAPWKMNTGAANAVYIVRFIFRPQYINEQIGFVKTDFDAASKEGLQDIVLKKETGSTTTVVKVSLATGCDAADPSLLFPTELTDPDTWIAKAANGSAIVVSSVALAAGVFTVTLASAGATLTLISPADLADAGIVGFEAKVLSLT